MRFLITAGPTREYLDPVRFLSNASSGKMGCALAAAAAKEVGHEVTLILGPGCAEPPEVDELARVTSAEEMFEAVAARFDTCDVFISAAAVCDYRPVCRKHQKIKKDRARLSVELERTPDILAEMAKRKGKQILVGFCLETEDLEARARAKLSAKRLDLVVGNAPEAVGADHLDALLIGREGRCQNLTHASKSDLAAAILKAIRMAAK